MLPLLRQCQFPWCTASRLLGCTPPAALPLLTRSPPRRPQVGRLLAALVSSLEGAAAPGGEQGGEELGEEEFGGYSAAYARLHNAHK